MEELKRPLKIETLSLGEIEWLECVYTVISALIETCLNFLVTGTTQLHSLLSLHFIFSQLPSNLEIDAFKILNSQIESELASALPYSIQ